jgi:hypothetical protein
LRQAAVPAATTTRKIEEKHGKGYV